MAEDALQTSFAANLDPFDSSSLTYFIPLETELHLEKTLEGLGESLGSYFESLECRDSLFFDESANVYLVLKTPPFKENATQLKSLSRRIVISLEVSVVNSTSPDRDSPPASEVIYAGTVEGSGDPVILAGEEDQSRGTSDGEDGEDGEDGQKYRSMYLVWKLPVFLGRPRMRLQGPSAVFTATASLKPADVSMSEGLRDGYLSSGVASGLNLLESFGNDPAMDGIKPRLSALRVSRVAPVTQQTKDMLRPIKSDPKQLSLRVYPAAHTRIRYARPNTTPPSSAIIAMLEVDFTPFFDCEVALTSISMHIYDGTVEDLSKTAINLPTSCVAHDHVTFLYRIAPKSADVLARNPTRDLHISIEATAMVQPGICTPKLTMAWTTAMDFTLPVNPGFGSASQPIQRSHRPSQLSIGSITSLTAPSVARPDALPTLEAASNRVETTVRDLGITLTFSAPPPSEKIYPGKEFTWTVFIVNRSPPKSITPPRKIALVAIPKRRRNESRVNRPPSVSHPSMNFLGPPRPRTSNDKSVADAVVDDNVVHAMQRSSTVDSVEMVCLSADVRIGSLAPGACHVVELRFLALKTGIVGIEAVRAIDLGTNEHIDIRDLPTTFVDDPDDEGAKITHPIASEVTDAVIAA